MLMMAKTSAPAPGSKSIAQTGQAVDRDIRSFGMTVDHRHPEPGHDEIGFEHEEEPSPDREVFADTAERRRTGERNRPNL